MSTIPTTPTQDVTVGTLEYHKKRAAAATKDFNDFTDPKGFTPGDVHYFNITDWGLLIYVLRGYALLVDKDNKSQKKAVTIVASCMNDAKKVIAKTRELNCKGTSPLADWQTCVEKALQELYPHCLFVELAPPNFDTEKASITFCYDDIGVVEEPATV